MRNEKELIKLFKGLVDLIAEESIRNPEFSAKLDSILPDLLQKKNVSNKKLSKKEPLDIPDFHAELNTRNEVDFILWLRNQPITVLREIIRREDLDPARRSARWKDPQKLANFISENLRARKARGSAFIDRE